MFSRRLFLKSSAAAMFGVGEAPLWLARAAYAKDSKTARKKLLIVVFQRGAVDGLSVVVPHGEPEYYAARPSIAIARPGAKDPCAIDLDGHFGLHPALAALAPLWNRKELAIVEAVGSPDPTRSHFDAQDYMESGTPGYKATVDGWLNRALPEEADPSPARAIALGPELPRSLRGRKEALAVNSIADFRVKDKLMAADFASLYSNSNDRVLNGAARETMQAMQLMQSIQKTPYTPSGTAQYPKGRFGESMQQIARMIKANAGLEVAFTDLGGWDTHVDQSGQLANRLREFADGLAAFSNDMGDRMADIVVVTMSEFGRTVRENGNRGTDHGHANVMLAMGGGVHGGQVYGDWPGMQREQLYEGRDLAVTTDFRAVLSELVAAQLGARNLNEIFPGFSCRSSLKLLDA